MGIRGALALALALVAGAGGARAQGSRVALVDVDALGAEGSAHFAGVSDAIAACAGDGTIGTVSLRVEVQPDGSIHASERDARGLFSDDRSAIRRCVVNAVQDVRLEPRAQSLEVELRFRFSLAGPLHGSPSTDRAVPAERAGGIFYLPHVGPWVTEGRRRLRRDADDDVRLRSQLLGPPDVIGDVDRGEAWQALADVERGVRYCFEQRPLRGSAPGVAELEAIVDRDGTLRDVRLVGGRIEASAVGCTMRLLERTIRLTAPRDGAPAVLRLRVLFWEAPPTRDT